MLPTNEQSTCPVCGQPAFLKQNSLTGYLEGSTFDVYHCPDCGLAYVNPRETSEEVYNFIYRHADRVPGYSRYYGYAETVAKVANPLDYLANSEATYWAVAQHVRAKRREKGNNIRVLDVGCGLGYVTYALAKDGFNVVGVDISQDVVASATQRFGPHYRCADIVSLLDGKERFDVVLCLQVIEHVPDIFGFAQTLVSVLADGGDILFVTPNRSFHESDCVWHTDMPPVHLSWFSEESFKRFAHATKCDLTLVDLEPYNIDHYVCAADIPKRSAIPRTPIFNRAGKLVCAEVVPRSQWRKIAAWIASLLGVKILLQQLAGWILRGERRYFGPRGDDLCAIWTKQKQGP